MTIKVIGAGFGRTGTMSLKGALEELGFSKCYHMMECVPDHYAVWAAAHRGEAIDWSGLLDGYQATVDWPSSNLWREQMAEYPDAKVILSLRDPEAWYKSVMNTIYPACVGARDGDDAAMQAFGNFAFEVVWDHVFDGRIEDKAHVIDVFNRHNETVKAEVPADKLLVYTPGDGWEPLCAFLDVPVPDMPYPMVNTTEDFNKGH